MFQYNREIPLIRSKYDYDIVQLFFALDLKGTHQSVDHGSIIAINGYPRHYVINNTSILFLTFALGSDITSHRILSLSYPLAMNAIAFQ